MKELQELIRKGSFYTGDFKDSFKLLEELSQKLIEEGFVVPQYMDEIIKREITYPTGLITSTLNVSIPHSEPEFVLKEGIIIVVPNQPVPFGRMDDPSELINVELSFILLLKDKNKHIKVLQQLATLLQSSELPRLKLAKNITDVECILEEMN